MADEQKQKFYGVKLTDITGKVYYTEVEVNHNLTHNINVVTHKPLSSKFPYHTVIGQMNYWSGTITGAFEKNDEGECEHDYTFGDTGFRINFIEWLHNGLTKTMFLSENFILPVTILSEVNVETEKTIDDPVVKASFSWEQCGERIYSTAELYCPVCGQTLVSATKFCPNCGKAVNFTNV